MKPSLHSLKPEDSVSRNVTVIVIVACLLVGLVTGYFAFNLLGGSAGGANASTNTGQKISEAKKQGVDDKKTFKDSAEGIMREGGFEDEGSHHLERPGGKSQYVYLTSSTVDLGEFTGKKVKVWGQTNTAQKAGWLMDVGLVEVQ